MLRARAAQAAQLAQAVGTMRHRVGIGPLLSIVVPVYNVEEYLAECLDSLLAQTYRNIEIIVVNDGATDRSGSIAADYAARHRRIRIHTQPNQGLSAARNAGAALARGTYLWFVDSDDTVTRRAAETMVASLQRSGSDFAVACYDRFDSEGTRKPGSWIRRAHTADRHHIAPRDIPDILVNTVAWSKMYRRSFWTSNHFEFPVGMLYEDQPVSARAYALASHIDIVSDAIYHWRSRDDGSSISQQSHLLGDLAARLDSARQSLAQYAACGAADMATERAVQLLANDMQHSMLHLTDSPHEFADVLADGIGAIAEVMPAQRWHDIPAHIAAVEHLVIQRDFDRARSYVAAEGLDANTVGSHVDGETVIMDVPFLADPEVNYPRDVVALSPSQLKPNLAIRRARWSTPGTLTIEGWAYLPFVAHGDLDRPATARLVTSAADGHTAPLDLQPQPNPDIDRISKHQIHDFTLAGFITDLDIDALALRPGADYRFEVTLSAAGKQYTAPIVTVHARGSAAALTGRATPAGVVASLQRHTYRPATLRVRPTQVRLDAVTVTDGSAMVTVQSPLPVRALRLAPNAGLRARLRHRDLVVKARPLGDGRYGAIFPAGTLAAIPVKNTLLRATVATGQTEPVAWTAPPVAPIGGGLFMGTGQGEVAYNRSAPAVHIDTLTETDTGIHLAGTVIGTRMPDTVEIYDYRYRATATVTVRSDPSSSTHRFEAVVPWHAELWGRRAPLPKGVYQIAFTARRANGTVTFATVPSEHASATAPLWLTRNAPLAGRVEIDPRTGKITLTVERTLAMSERGARPRHSMTTEHRMGDYAIDEAAVLFRTYYGESTTGNALAIHQHLRRTRKDLTLYWAVQDSSVRLPEGAVPVVVDSQHWFETLSTAKYLVDNVHQPSYFTKRDGQVLLQTLHGYPFKQAGLRFWEHAGFGQARIDSFLARHQQWDYLLSPAPYATPLLERDFPSSATTLEIGYPRNDIFFNSDALVALRDATRRRLGLSAAHTVVLYAPTYRDNLSAGEFRSRMVEFLDVDRFRDALPNMVLLVRGHMMNARVASRLAAGDPRIIDVTDYPEITELCAASDAAILDYSSLRFDYALTGKPMVFLVPDRLIYDDVRGSMLPYESTAPGPLADNTDEVIAALSDLPALEQHYAADRSTFISMYMPLEDGHATERAVAAVFGQPPTFGQLPSTPAEGK